MSERDLGFKTAPAAGPMPLAASNPRDARTGGREEVAAAVGLDRTAIWFLLAHIPAGVVVSRFALAGTVHAILCAMFGLWCAASRQRLNLLLCCLGYIAGAEVIWRLAGASPVYEFGKYATIGLCTVALVVRGSVPQRAGITLLLLSFLLPSSLLTLDQVPWDEARRLLSFNLSGPIAIAISAAVFASARITRTDRVRILVAALAPVLGLAAVTLVATATATDLEFTSTANKATSGGFGPNQVANTLGFGTLVALILVVGFITKLRDQVGLLAAALWFMAASALTFSRGGLYSAAAAALVFALFALRSGAARLRFVVAASVVGVVAAFVIFPALDDFTGGKLSERFESTDTTGRDEIAQAEIQVWLDNFVFGIGPGMGAGYRGESVGSTLAHTEYTRLLSEHGLFGLATILVLVVLCAVATLERSAAPTRAVSAAMSVWALTIMLHSALRLVGPAFAIGFACAGDDERVPARTGETPAGPVAKTAAIDPRHRRG